MNEYYTNEFAPPPVGYGHGPPPPLQPRREQPSPPQFYGTSRPAAPDFLPYTPFQSPYPQPSGPPASFIASQPPPFTRLTPQTMYSQTPPNEPFTGGFRVDAPGPPPLPQAFLPPPALAYPAAPVAPYGFRLPTPAGPATLSPSPLNPIHTSMASTNSSTTFWPPHLNEGPRAHLNPVRPEVAHPPSSSPQVTVASHPGLYGPRHSNVSTPANPDHVSSNSFNSTSSEHPTILPQGQQDVASPPALSQPNEDFQYSTCTGKRKGLCIGINYTNSEERFRLRGCVNDAIHVRSFLIDCSGFCPDDVRLLVDEALEGVIPPTRQNIIQNMKWLIEDAKENDSLFFHFSGHGGQEDDISGDEVDGMDECIYPVDWTTERKGILDDLMHEIMVEPLPSGCRLTALFDCCHSGSMLDLPYLYRPDGRDKESQVANGVWANRYSTADVISLSACEDKQGCADVHQDGVYQGAMSHAFIECLTENPHHSYQSLLHALRKVLKEKYEQKPQLSSSHKIDTSLKFIIAKDGRGSPQYH